MTITNLTIEELERLTPIIEHSMDYQSEIKPDEIRERQIRIAELTVEIDNINDEIKSLQDEIKADTQERRQLADDLDRGTIGRIAETAAKFYDPDNRTISIYVKESGDFNHVLTREAYSSEVEQWKLNQEAIRQQEIEAGNYRQKLHDLAADVETEA
jgi:hypothetical protein